MPIALGSQLGPYEILATLGSGGKAQVYRARDPTIGREVAIKLLPPGLAPDPGREALLNQARAAIGQPFPHCCLVLDVGHDQGHDYVVMELIDGEPLPERIQFGPMPVPRAVRYGRQILDALESARARGLVDRIVDPANMMLTPAGIKLLDFRWSLPTAPRIHSSPERAGGQRSDIFSFGMTMYEMLTGKKPFASQAAILETDPIPLRTLVPAIPQLLEQIVAKCLAKDPRKRWQSIADLRDALLWVEDPSELHGRRISRSERRSRQRTERLAWGGVLVILAMALVWALSRDAPPAQPAVMARAPRTNVALAPAEGLENLLNPSIAMSPDGTSLVYVGRRSGETALWMRRLDRVDATPLAGTEDAANPVFSPDGRWIAFAARGRLRKVPVIGGTPVDLAAVADLRGISWSRPEEIVYALAFGGGIQRIPADGGEPVSVTKVERTKAEYGHHWPFVIPRTDILLYARLPWRRAAMDEASIVAVSMTTGREHVLVEGGTQPRYVSPGHLVYSYAGTLYAAPLDLDEMALTEKPAPVAESVLQSESGAAHYSVSENGRLVYLSGGLRGLQRQLVWVDRSGSVSPLLMARQAYVNPRVSPDGRRVAARVVAPFGDVVMYDLAGDYLVRLPLDGDNHAPVWAEQGERLLLQTVLPDSFVLRWLRPDGSSPPEVLLDGRAALQGAAWSDQDQRLVATEGSDILVMSFGRAPTRLTEDARFPGSAPAVSTDGRWLAYVGQVGGANEVFVRPFPTLQGNWQVTTGGGTDPVWASTGELFYRQGSRVMVMQTTMNPEFHAEPPRSLFDVRIEFPPDSLRNYDVTLDGKRFLMVKSDESISVPQATVVLGWSDDLRRVQ